MAGKQKWRYFKKLDETGTSSSSKSRHPRGLSGREIGEWYKKRRMERDAEDDIRRNWENPSYDQRRQRRQERTERRKHASEKKPLACILMSENKRENINKVLKETESIYPLLKNKDNSYEELEETDFKHEFLQHITGNIIQKLESKSRNSTLIRNSTKDKQMLDELEEKELKPSYQKMQEFRNKLPSMGMKDNILEMVNNNQISVISGETGCGKTTQVAQFILDDYIKKGRGSECSIICTQPRRISAISVAERVAHERDEHLGTSVGYQIRLEKNCPRDIGSILFCTTGVVLKFMESNPALTGYSHLILDEIHERDVISDFLITLLKDVVRYRTDLKVILMSATINSEAFSKYYNNAPHINIPGFTFPVKEYFLEDVLMLTGFKFISENKPIWMRQKEKAQNRDAIQVRTNFIEPYLRQLETENKYSREVINELRKPESEQLNIHLIFTLLVEICKEQDDGGILVFVPGFADISKLITKLNDSKKFSSFKYIIIPLHSQLPTVDQKQIFNPAPKGMRKIIISTNIAETSITIDDVTIVIDCGFIKISNIDADSGIETLKPELVSQANAAQRKGRAGRVKPGICYHLITKGRYDLLDKFLKPEVLRKRLDDVILTLKMLQLGDAEPFLAKLMDPPESKTVRASIDLLRKLGALDDEESLTPLGFHMAKLPVGSQCSKMLIMAALFSCVDPVLSVAASLGYKDAYQISLDSKESDKMRFELSRGSNSDHMCMHYAIRGYEDAIDGRAFCKKYYLSSPILRLLIDFRKQFASQLHDLKFMSHPDPRNSSNNRNSENIGLVKAIIASGLYPNVAILWKITKGGAKLRSLNHDPMSFHPKSVLAQTASFPSALMVYYLKLKTAKLYIHDATVVFPLTLVFFGDHFRIHSADDTPDDPFNGISINGNMRFLSSEGTSLTIKRLRDRLSQILEWKVAHPGFVDWGRDTPEVKLLRVIIDLIATEDSDELNISDYDDI